MNATPSAQAGQRAILTFRAVNRRGWPGYDPGLQRHHLLPRQLLRQQGTAALLRALGRDHLPFKDFRANGLLLPASDRAALRLGLPLHRGPHRDYNALVAERVGRIEADWARQRLREPERALNQALERLRLLQRALRRRLLDQRRRLRLNRQDPLGSGANFGELDALVDSLWLATEAPTKA
jgi:hypothetical protein